MNRYEIYIARLEPVMGSEMAKTRPVVIVTDNLRNNLLDTVVACPLTTQLHPNWRSRLLIASAGKRAEIAVDQIRVLSKKRLGRKLGSLTATQAAALRALLAEMYCEP